ncbi:TPA: fimbrial biogenesis outer membrane usher protein [Klebsiella pneumoniae]|uniref:fimbria/pilus outer membrane usher protein n=1 Tax=Klebsiella pneumoniae TaxID=573 RepID=UPI000C1DFA9D|nr:fimbria/pilus outer membrane usher protein [Klebsiella pneumoniae]SVX71714.1 putative fimbrial biogenesis outer membrane usher protein [Klebsiella pneumoniae]SWF04802.1 putative fimbrial biogenesis outer membrane usher protein [Klebsiella pneumoniae]HBV6333993.1 fimbrial biogenesis outer membrane usher protein [Klebsiella pneumoniae]HBY7806741.1 fimbrial biogenesis outer membrane usher protein [Klebsiella pneumoniae]
MPNKNNGLFKLSTIFFAMLPALLSGLNNKAQARDFFDPSFISSLNGSDPSTTPDLSVFQTQNAQAPGDYRVDIMFNGRYLDTRTIKFVANNRASSDNREPALVPCLSLKALAEYGVRIKSFPELAEDQNGCANFSVIPDTKADFDFTAQRLNISIPQAALSTTAQGYIPPDQFDDGINALLVNYQFSGSNDMQANDEYYSLNLQSGLNVGPWRIRNLSTWNKNNGDAGDWDSAYLYMQRSIRSINSNLVMGESSSLSTIFDSVPFTGIQLATDTTMLPESMRGYAPIIRGIAKTNARVVIKQNGYQVYQTYVAPGAFEITDMYPSGGSGDLYVSVEESDGSKQEFVVPFATLPVMVRENQLEYEITSGKYRPYDGGVDETPFTQATATYGVSSSLTLYGGMQAASRYQALSTGLGYNLGELGAASADVTQAWSKKKDDEKTSGQSWRVRYGKNIVETGTNVTIAGYRYSTRGFNTLSEVLDSYSNDGNYTSRSLRNRTNLTVNQSLGKGLGSLSISGLIEDYWDDKRTNKSISVGYNGGFRNVNYYLGYSYNRYTWSGNNSGKDAQDDQRITLTVTLPLSNWLPGTYTSYQLTNSNPGSTDQSVSIGGVGLDNDSLEWSLQQGYSNREYYSGDMRGTYNGARGSLNAGYSYDNNSQRIDYGANGSIVAHADGITLGQDITDAAVLVKAPGLDNVKLTNDNTISTDYRGYAIVPYVTPYRRTDITLDSTTLGEDMELPETTQSVVPTRGAIVRANYDGNIGQRAFVHLKTASGQDVPYGAMVLLAGDSKSQPSIVSDAGMVYMSGLQQTGILNVQWGKSAAQQCNASFTLPAREGKATGISQIETVCH